MIAVLAVRETLLVERAHAGGEAVQELHRLEPEASVGRHTREELGDLDAEAGGRDVLGPVSAGGDDADDAEQGVGRPLRLAGRSFYGELRVGMSGGPGGDDVIQRDMILHSDLEKDVSGVRCALVSPLAKHH